jgi:cytochrome c heme-lyase
MGEKSTDSKCPISGQSSSGSACPMKGASDGAPAASTGGGCPVSPRNIFKFFTGIDSSASPDFDTSKPYKNPNVYNVYSEKIDPTNQMPANPANTRALPDQTMPLEVNRQKSSIPKGGTDDEVWAYPSPQMFWNSLNRKNKVDGAKEEDMDIVVAVHNNMNEKTWNEVMKWEQLKGDGVNVGGPPKLLRFQGKPYDLSIKARLKMFFGHPAPFDRHDWWVDQGGRINRYIIDYYHDVSSSSQDLRPSDNLTDFASMKSIQLDVRPAYDNFFGLYGRLFVMPFKRLTGMTTFSPLPFFAAKKMITEDAAMKQRINDQWKQITSTCSVAKAKLQACKSEEECGAAAVALQRCTASVVCPDVVKAFDAAIEASKTSDSEEDIQKAFTGITSCLDAFEIDCRSAKDINV